MPIFRKKSPVETHESKRQSDIGAAERQAKWDELERLVAGSKEASEQKPEISTELQDLEVEAALSSIEEEILSLIHI